jgi:hypothetical protein
MHDTHRASRQWNDHPKLTIFEMGFVFNDLRDHDSQLYLTLRGRPPSPDAPPTCGGCADGRFNASLIASRVPLRPFRLPAARSLRSSRLAFRLLLAA